MELKYPDQYSFLYKNSHKNVGYCDLCDLSIYDAIFENRTFVCKIQKFQTSKLKGFGPQKASEKNKNLLQAAYIFSRTAIASH